MSGAKYAIDPQTDARFYYLLYYISLIYLNYLLDRFLSRKLIVADPEIAKDTRFLIEKLGFPTSVFSLCCRQRLHS